MAEGTDGSLVQSGQEAFGTSGSDRLTLDSDNFKASIDSSIYEYTGDVITPDVSVLTASGSVLASGIDYEVTYSDNVAPGCRHYKSEWARELRRRYLSTVVPDRSFL